MKGKTLIEQSVRFTNGEIGAIFAPTELNAKDFELLRRNIDLLEEIVEYDNQQKKINEDIKDITTPPPR